MMPQPPFLVEEVHDPAEVARCRSQDERARRNHAWLQSHWAELLPHARGRFLAVAGQQAFLGDTPDEAWAHARAAHPDDKGAFSQYVPLEGGPRVYDNRG